MCVAGRAVYGPCSRSTGMPRHVAFQGIDKIVIAERVQSRRTKFTWKGGRVHLKGI